MLIVYGPTNGLWVCQKEAENSCRCLNPNYAQTLIPMESVPALIPLIQILGSETRKYWMPREEESKPINLLSFNAKTILEVRLKEAQLLEQ